MRFLSYLRYALLGYAYFTCITLQKAKQVLHLPITRHSRVYLLLVPVLKIILGLVHSVFTGICLFKGMAR